MQDNRHLKLAKLHEVQKTQPQLVAPRAKYLAYISSWTLRPPKNAAGPKPSAVGVILLGQFYVYNACPERVEKANNELGSTYKVGSPGCLG